MLKPGHSKEPSVVALIMKLTANKQTGGHVARGDAALAARKREVAAQLAKRLSGRQWN